MPRHSISTTNNRDSYIPHYIQGIDSLTDFIECDKFLAGYQLPAEAKLCHSFAVSHPVICQAFEEIEYKRLIYHKKGRGTFIAEPKNSCKPCPKPHRLLPGHGGSRAHLQSEVLKQEKVPAAKKSLLIQKSKKVLL